MYLSLLFALAAIVAVSLGGLQVATSLAVAAERHAALRYADVALEQARAALVAQIAAQVAAGSPDGPFVAPSPSPTAPVCPAPAEGTPPPCPFSASVSVALLGQTGSSAAPNELAQSVERAPGAAENRLAATLTATVVSPAGSIVRSRTLVLRTYPAPPFASDDGSDEPIAGNLASGDSGGTCDGSPGCGGDDTRIHAKLICSDPADPAGCAGMADRYVDNFTDENWQNAHALPRSWSQ
jgi:hypothetical protein